MQELTQEELDAVDGGGVVLVIAAVAVAAAVGLGIYNGYQEEKKASKQQK